MTLGLPSVMITHHRLIHLPTTAVTFMATTTSDYELNTFHQSKADIDSHIRLFWDDFPCPPPWRPSILTEVNISKLGPQIGQSVQKFLVGKCRLQSEFPAIQLDPEWSEDEFDVPGSMGGGDRHATSTSSSPDQPWCDQTCQIVIGLSSLFVVIVIVLLAIVFFHRSRRSHKMPSTRPSRQQLQMSTSTSDPVNWAEFSNTQVQFDDDMIYPPFRHRDLPSPPSQCYHPSCDPKWTCPNGSSFRPLMRVSPASTAYCTRGYTAVYEKIDDEDDEYYDDRVPCNHTRSFRRRERNMSIPSLGYRPANGVPFIPESHANAARYREEETGFNGDNFPVSILPRYFELQDTQHNPNPRSPQYEDQMNLPDNHTNGENDSSMATRTANGPRKEFQMHGTLFNNHNNMCNQLCATCVSNVVSPTSPPPCFKSHSSVQGELVSNVNSFNFTAPISSSTNGVSGHSTHISGYYPPPTSSFLQLSNSVDGSTTGIDPPPYSDQGCDLRCRNNSRASEGGPLYQNDNNDGGSLFTDLTQTQLAKHPTGSHNRACHVTQTTSPISSPYREWCPSCQQVPLLNRNNPSDNLHSACPAWPKPQNNNSSSQHPTILRRTHGSDDKSLVSDNDNEVDNILINLNEENDVSRNVSENGTRPYDQRQRHETNGKVQERESGRGNGCGAQEIHINLSDDGKQGLEDPVGDCELPTNTMSLHSHYFNKT